MTDAIQVHIEGLEKFQAAIVELGVKADTGLASALFHEAEGIMRASKQQAPVDSGVLRGSGHVGLPQRTAAGVTVTFGYGGAAQAYANIQETHDDYTHAVGKSRYLGDPVHDAAHGMGERLALSLRKFITL